MLYFKELYITGSLVCVVSIQSNSESFGNSIDISGDGNTIGFTCSTNDGSTGLGWVKIFKLISNTWTQIGQTITGALEREYFGTGFSLSDDGTIFTVSASQFYIINEKGYTNIYKFNKKKWYWLVFVK